MRRQGSQVTSFIWTDRLKRAGKLPRKRPKVREAAHCARSAAMRSRETLPFRRDLTRALLPSWLPRATPEAISRSSASRRARRCSNLVTLRSPRPQETKRRTPRPASPSCAAGSLQVQLALPAGQGGAVRPARRLARAQSDGRGGTKGIQRRAGDQIGQHDSTNQTKRCKGGQASCGHGISPRTQGNGAA